MTFDPTLFAAFFDKGPKAEDSNIRRRGGSIPGSVKHAMIHTSSPDATLHHTVIAQCPHPLANRLPYWVGYVSIPNEWYSLLTPEFMREHSVSFVGPPGQTQRLTPALHHIADVVAIDIYIGFDWMHSEELLFGVQVVNKLNQTVRVLRELYEKDKT